ncbi:MAG: tetratricopeptide repeat protein [Myxococcales bacterium]
MNESLRRSTPLFIAASALCALAACKQKRSPEAQPVVQRASLASVATPAAATAKPIDASEAVRGADRPQPTPRPAPCLSTSDGQDAPVPDLLEQAAREFEKGRFEGALECAREASRLDEQSVAAHHFRGAALAELGRVDEARTAYARALVLDPDDPEVLRSAADLHVRRFGARDDLELALAYVRRGLVRAHKLKDRPLLKDLYLLQAMAYDDLGRPGDALGAANHALEADMHDRETRREKGVALFELSRFDEAKAELSKLSADEPDAWAEHYLGLIAERSHDDAAAAQHFAKAQKLDPDAFRSSRILPCRHSRRWCRKRCRSCPRRCKTASRTASSQSWTFPTRTT